MYFLMNGQVAILDDEGDELLTLGPGSFFGEIALLENIERTATIMAKTFCSTLMLSSSAFQSVEGAFPAAIQMIRTAAKPRVEEVLP